MAEKLKNYFPIIRDRKELLLEIKENPRLREIYEEWSPENREEFLDFCTGVKGMKILYDSFFKEVMNPEYAPERLETLLCVLLRHQVKIVRILPHDSTRIADETSLLITDIVVELEDGSLANVEIQKIGYAFPGPRSACYSADMLLRQYKRVRAKQGYGWKKQPSTTNGRERYARRWRYEKRVLSRYSTSQVSPPKNKSSAVLFGSRSCCSSICRATSAS